MESIFTASEIKELNAEAARLARVEALSNPNSITYMLLEPLIERSTAILASRGLLPCKSLS